MKLFDLSISTNDVSVRLGTIERHIGVTVEQTLVQDGDVALVKAKLTEAGHSVKAKIDKIGADIQVARAERKAAKVAKKAAKAEVVAETPANAKPVEVVVEPTPA